MFPIISGAQAAIRMPQIPATWTHLLDILALHFDGHAVLGGGALRDLLHDRPIKDLDIFVNPTEDLAQDAAFLEVNFGAKPHEYDPDEAEYDCAHTIAGLYDFVLPVNLREVQVVLVANPRFDCLADVKTIVDTFDIGLCQIGMNNHGSIYYSPAFAFDYFEKMLTVVRDSTPRSTYKRLDKLKAKYPGHKINAELLAPCGDPHLNELIAMTKS